MLQSQLYGPSKDLCKMVSDEIIQSNSSANAIVNGVYKRNASSTASDVYHDLMSLLNLKRGSTDSFRSFESCFESQVSKLNAHSDS